jgi:hypothetical protein
MCVLVLLHHTSISEATKLGFGHLIDIYLKLGDTGKGKGKAISWQGKILHYFNVLLQESHSMVRVFLLYSNAYGMDLCSHDIWYTAPLDPSDCQWQDQIEEPYGFP